MKRSGGTRRGSEERGGFIRNILFELPSGRKDFPFNIPALKSLGLLDLHPKVTFFVGENGSGKSTLLEGIAQAAGFDQEGGSKNFNNLERQYWSELGSCMRLGRPGRPETDGFFLRAESFFNVATRIEELGIPLKYYGGKSPHEQSHGESFLALAANRFAGEGLYLLDEPEAALSPARQLSFLRIMHLLIEGMNSQFIISTHSPILMAYPDAWIYHFSEDGLRRIEYEETEHFRLTRDFLNNREAFLHRLFQD